jgi:hypothetical protein
MKYHYLTVILIISVLPSSGLPLPKQGIQALQTPVHNYEINATSITIALADVAKRFRVVIGVNQTVPSATAQLPVKARISDGKLSDVLDILMQGNPGYQWKLEPDGAVHVTRAGNSSTITDVVLDRFEIANIQLSHLTEAVYQAPEVQQWVREQQCPRREMVLVFGGSGEGGPLISLRAEREPLSKVLDDIASHTGNFFWSVSQYHLNEQCFSAVTF